jgi:hypothetical protein
MANETQMKFTSAATTCISLTSTLADGSVGGGTSALDNSTDLYPLAQAVFNNPDAFASAPTDGSTVDLYMVRQDVDGTSDDTSAPTGTDIEAAEYVGSFKIYNTNEEQRNTQVISLTGVQSAHFYIQNNCGQTLSYTSAPITVKVHPFTFVPF